MIATFQFLLVLSIVHITWLLIMIATFQCLFVLSMVHITWLLTDYDCYLPMSACAQYSTHHLVAN